MSHQIKNVVFDFGNVLVNWDPKNLYGKIFDDEAEMEHFLTNVFPFSYNHKVDEGASKLETTEMLVKLHPEHEDNIRAYYGRWKEMFSGAIQESVEILKELHSEKKVRLFGLTNWAADFEDAIEVFPFFKLFEDIVVSGVERVAKPDPKIYKILLTRNNLKAEECFFMDDKLENIEAANRLGFQTYHFDTPEGLRNHMTELGLL